MALRFCDHEDVVFGDAPLVMVLTQVKFSPILSLLTASGVAGFQAGLREIYPKMLPPVQQASIEVRPGGQATATALPPTWRFTDPSGKWIVGLAQDFVSLETPEYISIETFIARFEQVLSVLRRVVRPAESTRIGLRKINVFEAPGRDTLELARILRPELLGVLGVAEFPAPITQAESQVAFQDEDNALVVRSGIVPAEGREVVRFSLDMDYFTERPYQIGDDPSISQLLNYFSQGMTNFFHWAVLDSHLETLRPRPREKATQ